MNAEPQYVQYEGRNMRVAILPADVPDAFDLQVYHDGALFMPDPIQERAKRLGAARVAMQSKCGADRQPVILDEQQVQAANYLRFACRP